MLVRAEEVQFSVADFFRTEVKMYFLRSQPAKGGDKRGERVFLFFIFMYHLCLRFVCGTFLRLCQISSLVVTRCESAALLPHIVRFCESTEIFFSSGIPLAVVGKV